MVPKRLEMPNSEGQNKDKRHIIYLEDDFLENQYDLMRLRKELDERIKLNEAIIKKFIEGGDDGNNSNNKTN